MSDLLGRLSKEELLQLLEEKDIIKSDAVQELIKMDKQEKILKQHDKPIWQGTNGRWYTYLPDDSKKSGRRQVAKSTEAKIKEAIIEFYTQLNEEQTITFKKMFYHWIEVQRSEVSQNTITKYIKDYRRCIQDTEIENISITEINAEMLRVFIGKRVKEVGLPQRAYTNLIGYFNGVFRSALENNYIERNPMEVYVVSRQFKNCKKSEKTKEDMTVSKDELAKIFKTIDDKLQKTPWNMNLYAILLATFTGMRVGELSALAWEDIHIEDGYIFVHQAEVRDVVEGKPCVFYISDTTKDGKEREIPMTAEMRNLFHYIRNIQKEMGIEAEFVFENHDGRVHKTAIASCADAVSKKAGVKSKSIHCYRKTLSSMLHSLKLLSGLEVSSILGHGVEVNAKYYSFDLSEMQPKQNALAQANKKVIDFGVYNKSENSVINSVIKSGVM